MELNSSQEELVREFVAAQLPCNLTAFKVGPALLAPQDRPLFMCEVLGELGLGKCWDFPHGL